MAVPFLELADLFSHFEEAKQKQQILSATVMMALTTPNWQEKAVASGEGLPIPNDEYRTIARAEGNVVADGQAVVGGDSGGGVWVHGCFAAAMWTTVMIENRATGVQRATDMSIAAVYQGI